MRLLRRRSATPRSCFFRHRGLLPCRCANDHCVGSVCGIITSNSSESRPPAIRLMCSINTRIWLDAGEPQHCDNQVFPGVGQKTAQGALAGFIAVSHRQVYRVKNAGFDFRQTALLPGQFPSRSLVSTFLARSLWNVFASLVTARIVLRKQFAKLQSMKRSDALQFGTVFFHIRRLMCLPTSAFPPTRKTCDQMFDPFCLFVRSASSSRP